MADDIRQLTHTTSDIDETIDEARDARGTYDTLDDRLDAQDEMISVNRAELVELVDSGAKNIGIPYSPDVSEGITVTVNADGSYTFVCTNVDSNKIIRVANISTHSTNTYIISGCSGGSSTTYMLGLYNPSATAVVYQYTEAVEQTRDISGYSLRVRIIAGYTGTFTIYPMICTKAAWDISHAYQPHRPSYQELYERVVALEQAQQ